MYMYLVPLYNNNDKKKKIRRSAKASKSIINDQISLSIGSTILLLVSPDMNECNSYDHLIKSRLENQG